ncbi:MAG: 4Fe-4S binding protein, partial [Kiritimatiellota bacterium]|nr:4Fe-4S binding protein [Kiritimatiellota bacterium]
PDSARRLIIANSTDSVTLAPGAAGAPQPDSRFEILVRLQLPYMDINLCTGCGICEHECPVSGRRAIRVTAENESRDPKHTLALEPASGIR